MIELCMLCGENPHQSTCVNHPNTLTKTLPVVRLTPDTLARYIHAGPLAEYNEIVDTMWACALESDKAKAFVRAEALLRVLQQNPCQAVAS